MKEERKGKELIEKENRKKLLKVRVESDTINKTLEIYKTNKLASEKIIELVQASLW